MAMETVKTGYFVQNQGLIYSLFRYFVSMIFVENVDCISKDPYVDVDFFKFL